jgi:excisionase family DNA binding protein
MPKTEVVAVTREPQGTSATPLPRLAYGIDGAAEALDLSRSRIYELIAVGEITACKVGKRTIIPATELTAFIERHRVTRLSGVRAALSVREERELAFSPERIASRSTTLSHAISHAISGRRRR